MSESGRTEKLETHAPELLQAAEGMLDALRGLPEGSLYHLPDAPARRMSEAWITLSDAIAKAGGRF